MKRRFLYIVSLIFLASACAIEEPELSLRHLDVDITVTSDLDGTRAVKTSWEAGDKVYVAFDDYFAKSGSDTEPLLLTLTYNGVSWNAAFSDPALEEYLLGRMNGYLTASYIPFVDAEFRYDPSTGIVRVGTQPATYSMSCNSVLYKITDNRLRATINLSLDSFVQFYLEDMPGVQDGRYTFSCNKILPSTSWGAVYYNGKPQWIYSNTGYGDALPGMQYKGGLSFSGRLHYSADGAPADYAITITDTKGTRSGSDDTYYTMTRSATLAFKDAVILPPLTDPAWTVKKPKTEMFAEWGLEGTLVSYVSNERSYEWYIDQGSTGPCSGVNCGPASSTMAAHWYDSSFTGTTQDARNEFYNNGGWWYTSDINAYFTNHGIAHSQRSYSSNTEITGQIDRGNIVLLCLDMYYITYGNVSGKRVNKFYNTSGTGWGHFLLVKGYVQTSSKLYFEVYDPYSMGRKYPDGTPMGKDRYYDSNDILTSAGIWWPCMITIGGH